MKYCPIWNQTKMGGSLEGSIQAKNWLLSYADDSLLVVVYASAALALGEVRQAR